MRCHRLTFSLMFLSMAVGLAIQTTPVRGQEPIKIAVGVDSAFVAAYVAKRNKLFEKRGVNVELVQFTQGGDGLDAVVAGQIPIGGGGEPTTMLRAARADLKVLGVISQSGTYIKLVVKPEISDPKQLKKLGIVPGSVNEFVTEQMLAKYGVDPSTVTFVRAGPPEFPALFARGDVDGYFLWEPWPANGVKQGGKILLASGDVGYVYNLWLSANGAWLEKNTAAAKSIMAALSDACELVRADPAVGAAAVQAEAKIPAAIATDMLKEVQCVVRDFTPSDLSTYEKIAAFLKSKKLLPAEFDAKKIFQVGFFSPK